MARTLNLAVHTVRREAFVEAAQRLMQTRGWEQMSIQDVLDAVEASRGAFYHYFDSKQALLEAVIERMVDAGLGEAAPAGADASLPAPAKLERVFSAIGRWKTEQKALVLALLEVWLSDHNATVREKFRRRMVDRLAEMLTPIIDQGMREGDFNVATAPETARVLVMLLLGLQDVATDLFLDRQAGRIELTDVERSLSAYSEAFERILGARAGSIGLIDQSVLVAWFG
jgi:AcrR family transcriptional regulator